jgi:hypothetical protein
MIGAGAVYAIARGGRGVLGYCRKNRWTWYAGGILALLAVGYYFGGIRKVVSSAESFLNRLTTSEKIVVSNANLLAVATGGVTIVTLDANGAPREIRNEGGTLRVEATIASNQKTTEQIRETLRSTSKFEESGRAAGGESWTWAGRLGYGLAGPDPAISLGVTRRVVSILGVDLGVELAGSVPRNLEGASDLRRRGRVEISLLGIF